MCSSICEKIRAWSVPDKKAYFELIASQLGVETITDADYKTFSDRRRVSRSFPDDVRLSPTLVIINPPTIGGKNV